MNQHLHSQLQPGQLYQVKKIHKQVGKRYRQQLLTMGMVPGAVFEVIRYAPFGDTMQVSVKGYALSLRQSELDHVAFEAICV